MNAYRIKKLGSIAVMNGLDAIIFTAGMGEFFLYQEMYVLTWSILEWN
jgi:acetate kinase